MSALVFKIEQGKAETQGKEQQISENTLGNTVMTPEAPAEGEKAAVDHVSEGAPAATPASDDGQSTDRPALTVKVDGPVGRVFTDALNKLLATEGYLTVRPEGMEDDPVDSVAAAGVNDPIKSKNLVQIYCWRTDAVNADDLIQLSNTVSRHSDRPFVVALESAASMTRAVGLLEDLQCFKNLKVCYSLESAANHVKGLACPPKK